MIERTRTMDCCTDFSYQKKTFSFQNFELQYLFHSPEKIEKDCPLLIIADGSGSEALKNIPAAITEQSVVIYFNLPKEYLKENGLDPVL